MRALRATDREPRASEAAIVAAARRYAPRLPPDSAYCNVTALALHGAALPLRLSCEPLHVNGPIDRARPVLPGVLAHRYAEVVVTWNDGIPVVDVVQAWVQSASRLSIDELVEVGDSLVRREGPLTSMDDLALAVERVGRRRGAARLRQALPWIRPRTDSPPETRTRLLIVRAGFPEPEVNPPVLDDDGRFLGYGDLAYARWKIVIEHEGEYHFVSAEQGRRDIDRLASFARAGWIVLRVHRGTLSAPGDFLHDLARAIRSRASRSPALGLS